MFVICARTFSYFTTLLRRVTSTLNLEKHDCRYESDQSYHNYFCGSFCSLIQAINSHILIDESKIIRGNGRRRAEHDRYKIQKRILGNWERDKPIPLNVLSNWSPLRTQGRQPSWLPCTPVSLLITLAFLPCKTILYPSTLHRTFSLLLRFENIPQVRGLTRHTPGPVNLT